MSETWLSLLPPLIVLTLGYLTRRVMFSLVCGIIIAGLIATDGAPTPAVKLITSYLWTNLELYNYTSWHTVWQSWNSLICIFLFVLGILVILMRHSGGAHAYGRYLKQNIHNARDAESASLLLSTALFVDDYFSTLTVGSVMTPITDLFTIPRVKLAFLIDSLGAPIAIIAPFSSWVAAILGFLKENKISTDLATQPLIYADPLVVYLKMIPFVFYSFVIIPSTWFIVRKRISFGAMKQHENTAHQTGNLFNGKLSTKTMLHTRSDHNKQYAELIDFIFPVAFLLIAVLAGICFSGDCFLFGGTRSIVSSFQHANAAIALFAGGTIALAASFVFLLMRRRIRIHDITPICLKGIHIMLPAIVILFLAWTLGDIVRHDLKAGEFLAHALIIGKVNPAFLPALFFIASLAISTAIGSSWGTAAIVFPIGIPLVLSLMHHEAPAAICQLPLLFPVLGAILSGAIAGDHISPISDTTIMSSTSTGSHHIDHVHTQLEYTLPIIGGVLISFVLSGALYTQAAYINILTSIGGGIIVSCSLLYARHRFSQN